MWNKNKSWMLHRWTLTDFIEFLNTDAFDYRQKTKQNYKSTIQNPNLRLLLIFTASDNEPHDENKHSTHQENAQNLVFLLLFG